MNIPGFQHFPPPPKYRPGPPPDVEDPLWLKVLGAAVGIALYGGVWAMIFWMLLTYPVYPSN